MPKTIYLPKDEASGHESSGLSITWTPSASRLDFGGWYDTFVGIPGGSMTLAEFFGALGITEQHCRKAWATRSTDKAES